jgi:hypothetical protein
MSPAVQRLTAGAGRSSPTHVLVRSRTRRSEPHGLQEVRDLGLHCGVALLVRQLGGGVARHVPPPQRPHAPLPARAQQQPQHGHAAAPRRQVQRGLHRRSRRLTGRVHRRCPGGATQQHAADTPRLREAVPGRLGPITWQPAITPQQQQQRGGGGRREGMQLQGLTWPYRLVAATSCATLGPATASSRCATSTRSATAAAISGVHPAS